ncbi:MAG TPA: GSCFA domain-containing protein [Reyranella sp.]|nr:GSCFA domain-containing protein [Reyranella sp.]
MIKTLTGFAYQEAFENDPTHEKPKRIGSSFFRGEHCNFYPSHEDHHLPHFLERFVLGGLSPAAPPIGRSTRVTAFGSCFADNIAKHLAGLGYDLSKSRNPDIYVSAFGEGLVNVHALAGQFEWSLENAPVPQGLWHGYKAEEYGYDEGVRQRTNEVFRSTEFFIITLGLSEVWYDEPTGGVFWRAVPLDRYDPTRHKFRVCSFAETKDALERMYGLIRKHAPQAKVLFSLSPIPLVATFRPIPALAASSASKAILRAALDEFMREHAADLNERLFYFPAFEIINELFFQKYSPDGRHIGPDIVEFVMKLFEMKYCDSTLTPDEVAALYRTVRTRNAQELGGITP